MTASRRVAQAVVAFLALPGVVAYLIPIVFFRASTSGSFVFALSALAIGSLGLLWCATEFFVDGGGTLAPWAPPKRLVRRGPYRLSRNPMYVSVLLVVVGWSLLFASWICAVYALSLALAFHLRVVCYEEPTLAITHGDVWISYRNHVPRWFGARRR